MNNKGFLLLEVMISLMILGLVIAACINTVSTGTRAVSSTLKLSQVNALSQEILARIRTGEFKTSGNGNFDNNFSDFKWQVNRTEADNLIRYAYTVSYKDKSLSSVTDLLTTAS